MTDTSLPDSSELTKEDFTHSDWRNILGDSPMDHCARAFGDLKKASEKSQESEDLPRAKVLLLLAATCSMLLNNKSRNEPFVPMWTIGGQSSPTPDWFTESDINFLAEILDDVNHPMLRGRLADIVWLRKNPREARFALDAIDNYRCLDLTEETWPSEIGDCWKRALVLTKMMAAGAGDRIGDFENALEAKFDSVTKENEFYGHWLAETLKEFGLGKNNEKNIAKKLADLGQELETDGKFFAARDYYKLAREWFRDAGQNSKQIDMQVAVAEGWAKEAEQRMSSDNPSALVAVGFYDSAIQTYREIPNIERESRNIGQRVTELIRLHEDAGERALGEMKTISTPTLDISETVQQAKIAVSGREPIEALNHFASLHQTNPKRLREMSQQNLAKFPLTAIVSQTMYTHDGRVAATTPGITPAGSPEENEPSIWAQMIRHYGIEIRLAVQGLILPALEIMHIEHRFRESDFIAVARNSPAVPPEREGLFGKALFNGYEYDFATAIHLLTPQIEHMVRYRLKELGVSTVHTDRHGIQDEKGLSSLVESPEFEQIFGEYLAFEIRALFCDHLGANLRNNVSHGLFTSQECQSIESVYAWWLGLKIAFRTYWAAFHHQIAGQRIPEDEPTDPNEDTKEPKAIPQRKEP